MEDKLKIICITQTYNELEKGNLKRFFKYIKPIVHTVVVYDDCSTDGTYEYLLKKTPYVIRGKKNDFGSEISHKQQALTLALTLNPDIILRLDIDEILSIDSPEKLNKLGWEMIRGGVDGYEVHEINLWRSQTWKRTDSLYNKGWFNRIWRVTPKMSFQEEKGLHHSGVPIGINKVVKTNVISVLHYGFSDDYNLAYKYLTYKSHGQRGYIMLDRLISEEKLAVQKVSSKLFPRGLYKDNEQQPTARSFTASLGVVESLKEKIIRPKYSIICLIYKDVSWLNFVYKQVIKYTDLRDCEFYFVANDATKEVKEYLANNYIPHYVFEDKKRYLNEWYINNVYRAWNFGASKAAGDFLIFINSDMAFTSNWLENLKSGYSGHNCVTSRLVESGRLNSGLYGISKSFGSNYKNYRERSFLRYAKILSKNELKDSGLFMPLFIRKSHFDRVGGYPEGNIVPTAHYFRPAIAKKGEDCIPGDAVLMKKLESTGINHQTAFNSVVYHFQMGEMSSEVSHVAHMVQSKVAICNDLVTGTMGEKVLWNQLLTLPASVGVDTRVVGTTRYERSAKSYINGMHRDVEVIIQNASYIHRIDESKYSIMLLQDNMRRMGNKNLTQEVNLHFADKIVTNSLQSVIDYPEYEMEYIPIVVNDDLFKPLNKQKVRRTHKLHYKKIGIFVGSFSKTKGFHEIKSLIRKRKDIFWLLVTKHNEVYAAKNARVYSQITQKLLVELLNCADFFIIGSKVETQCLAAVEAALCNVPLVMRRVGILENISENDLGRLGSIGRQFNQAIDDVYSHNYMPRKIMLKYNLKNKTVLSKWRHLIEEGMIKSIQRKQNSHYGNTLKKFISKHIYSKLGKDSIDINDVARIIIKYTPSKMYSIYRHYRYD